MHALRQDANWLSFIKLQGEKDPHQEKKMVELRTKNKVDELLRVMAKFMTVKEPEVKTLLKERL